MNIRFLAAAVISTYLIVLCAEATVVKKCQGDSPRKLNDNEITISNCNKGRCRLRKKTKVSVEVKFTPDHDVKKLITNVNGIILGVPLPFVGMDGTSACNNLYLEDGTKTQCPLKKGQKYLYRNTIDVLPIYPTIAALDVYWALVEGNNKKLICFEIPAKITN